eukprot:TRINITY_DN2593_c0_g1_i1.p1 TRINITY_DN2593_c0_g1~~TRINITY_DN2593_c0_g1_i1.p1  ORF type:complete len:778 (-),score=195.83 TRINITY_DN2593_c0_g1_i1:55-2388(-)
MSSRENQENQSERTPLMSADLGEAVVLQSMKFNRLEEEIQPSPSPSGNVMSSFALVEGDDEDYNPESVQKQAPSFQSTHTPELFNDFCIVYPIPQPGELPGSSVNSQKLFVRHQEHTQERDALVAKLRHVGLMVRSQEGSDKKKMFLLISIGSDRAEEQAELIEMLLPLKAEHSGGSVPFTRSTRDLFATYDNGELFDKTQRQRLIQSIIESDADDGGAETDLNILVSKGVLLKFYPLHENEVKDKLINEWVMKKKLLVPTPLEDLRHYFGEEIAFYFAWLAFYTRWLLFAGIVGIVATIIDAAIKKEGGWSSNVYAVFIGIWATLFLEFWKRKRNIYAWKWDMMSYEESEEIRPAFKGDEQLGAYSNGIFIKLAPTDVYGIRPPRPIKNYPLQKTKQKIWAGVSFIITLSIVVAVATISIFTFRLFLQKEPSNKIDFTLVASVVGGVLNAITILVLNKIYRIVAIKLNDWENHRTYSEYNNQLLFKVFLFQFVNSYTSMYYIAFFKDGTTLWGDKNLVDACGSEPNPDGTPFGRGCPSQLFEQLLILLGTNIIVGQAQEVLLPFLLAKVKLWWYERKAHVTDDDIPQYEREYELNEWEGTLDEYGEMVIQYGYITLFAASFPLAPVLAFVNNLIEMRTDTFKFLTSYNKPFYRGASDIGGWYTILTFMSVVAVITNALLLMYTFPPLWHVFEHLENGPYYMLCTVVLLEHAILLIKYVVSVTVPDVPDQIAHKLAKQAYIQSELMKKFKYQRDQEKYHVRLSSPPNRHANLSIESD